MNPETHIPIINLPGSKSISNRLLMIQAIGNLKFEIKNISNSDDTQSLQKTLEDIRLGKTEIDVRDAGTNMRFLSAFLSTLENKSFTLTGSDRMKERPIKDLVASLKSLGADIQYIGKEGYPPLKIKGKKLTGNEITISASVSSQFISSLLMIAPLFENGTQIKLLGKVVSPSYIQLSIELMRSYDIDVDWKNDVIHVKQGKYKSKESSVYNESDWSAASYYYSAMALGNKEKIELLGLNKESFQPDAKVADLYSDFGVKTEYGSNKITLSKTRVNLKPFKYDFIDCPDLAQAVAVTCLGLGIKAELTGLETLKLKETDRILALKNELEKLGAIIEVSNNSLKITSISKIDKDKKIIIRTYNDHRMAMSFAPLIFLYPNSVIENKEVVSKSFPYFWNEFSKVTSSHNK